MVQKKLVIYEQLTRPLVGLLESRGARVLTVDVSVDTVAGDIVAKLEEMGGK